MAAGLLVQPPTAVPWIVGNTEKTDLTIELVNRLKIKYAVAYGFSCSNGGRASSHRSLQAAMSTEHEEVEIIRCPVIEADTIDIPGWDKEIATPNFNHCHDEKTVDLAPGHAFVLAACTEAVEITGSRPQQSSVRVELRPDGMAEQRHLPRTG